MQSDAMRDVRTLGYHRSPYLTYPLLLGCPRVYVEDWGRVSGVALETSSCYGTFRDI